MHVAAAGATHVSLKLHQLVVQLAAPRLRRRHRPLQRPDLAQHARQHLLLVPRTQPNGALLQSLQLACVGV
jgi:hypothetical protein